MTLPFWLIRKQIAVCLAVLLASPFAAAAPTPFPLSMSEQSTGASQAPASNPAQPSAAQSGANESTSAQSTAAQNQSTNSPNAAQQQNSNPQPVGTAAAPSGRSLGVAASRPAGAVIAPAKQRRARSIFIKVGVIVGACVAVGTVAALSRSSSSTPH